jgi:hypothetical protein
MNKNIFNNEELRLIIGSFISALFVVSLFNYIGWFNGNSNHLIFYTMTNYLSLKTVKWLTKK